MDAIASISGVINQINDISNTIATAVEEQNATTNEMSRNVGEAAHGSGEITSNIAGVAEAAQSTTHGAAETQKASQQLVETSVELPAWSSSPTSTLAMTARHLERRAGRPVQAHNLHAHACWFARLGRFGTSVPAAVSVGRLPRLTVCNSMKMTGTV